MSEHEYAEYQRFKAQARRVHCVSELTDEAAVAPRHFADEPSPRSPQYSSGRIEFRRGHMGTT